MPKIIAGWKMGRTDRLHLPDQFFLIENQLQILKNNEPLNYNT